MSKGGTHTRIPRYAAQMDPNELSPLTVKRGVILDKPRRRDTQVSDTALARASAILHSPHATPQVTPGSTSSSSSSSLRMQKVSKQMMLEHFANLDIAMVYQTTDDDDENQAEAVEETKRSNRRRRRGSHESKDSMDMAEMFWSEH
eukprot:scaffold1353_cov161-Amphora_coffeaeformis.AAC.30